MFIILTVVPKNQAFLSTFDIKHKVEQAILFKLVDVRRTRIDK